MPQRPSASSYPFTFAIPLPLCIDTPYPVPQRGTGVKGYARGGVIGKVEVKVIRGKGKPKVRLIFGFPLPRIGYIGSITFGNPSVIPLLYPCGKKGVLPLESKGK